MTNNYSFDNFSCHKTCNMKSKKNNKSLQTKVACLDSRVNLVVGQMLAKSDTVRLCGEGQSIRYARNNNTGQMQLNFKSELHLCKHPLQSFSTSENLCDTTVPILWCLEGTCPREIFPALFYDILGLKGKVEECNVKKVAFETLFFEKSVLKISFYRNTMDVLLVFSPSTY